MHKKENRSSAAIKVGGHVITADAPPDLFSGTCSSKSEVTCVVSSCYHFQIAMDETSDPVVTN